MQDYNTSDRNANDKLRDLSYRANIPYYVLWDTDLDGHHFRLYGLIEQLESNPNPKVNATFSYAYFAEAIGVEPRHAKRIAKKLKDKNYIIHTQLSNGKWIWNTVKNLVTEQPEGGDIPGHPPVSPQDTPPVTSQDTQNTYRETHIDKTTTTGTPSEPIAPIPICRSESSSSIFSEKTDSDLLRFKLESDERSDLEFLNNVKFHIENNSDTKFPIYQRIQGVKKLLRNLFNANQPFKAVNYVDPIKKQQMEQKREQERLAREKAADEAHWKRIQAYEASMKTKPVPLKKGERPSIKEMLKGAGICLA